MNNAFRVALITPFLLVASCQSSHSSASDEQPFESEPQGQRRATVNHVVLCWLKPPGDEAARQKLIDTSRTFATIPGVVNVSAGRALPSPRPVVDSSFDVAIVITFTDEAALRAYDSHPTHKKAVEEVFKALAGKSLIYDFVDDAVRGPAR